MKIGFIFNAQPHQIFHSLPVACALARDYPQFQVTLLARSAADVDYIRRLASHYDAVNLHYQLIAPPPEIFFAQKAFAPKKLTLLWNLRTFFRFDALVVPERTSITLRRMGLWNTKFIHTTHGAGDDERDWDTRIRKFDLVLLPGRKRRDRLLAKGLLRPGHYYVSGYNKFDLAARMGMRRPPVFNNGRQTVLYNPHHDERHGSWRAMGRQVLEYFAQSGRFNLIFAPHIRMKDDGVFAQNEFQRYQNLEHMLIDTGSPRSVDMSYSLTADIYLGDWSSQLYEFLLRPRPAIFLNPNRLEWRGREEYSWWSLGKVAENISEMHAALIAADAWRAQFEDRQKAAFDYTFASLPEPAPERAARAIAAFLNDGWIEDDLT